MGYIEKIVLDDETLRRLEEEARRNGRTVEAQAREILDQAVRAPMSRDEFIRRADAIAAMTPKGIKQTDSTLLIREDRDSR